MDDTHKASPNSETTGRVTPASQNATSTAPSRLRMQENGDTTKHDCSEENKIVKTSPGV